MAELIFPSANNWIDAAEAGQKAGVADRMTAARRSAGGFMASGDYKGAASALYGAGDFTNGSTVAQAGYTQATEQSKLASRSAVQQKLATGDFAGAYQAAGTDKELLDGLDKVAAHAHETTGMLAASVEQLEGLPYDQARQKYQTEIAPALKARKILPDNQVDAFDPTPGNLSAIKTQVLGLKEQLSVAQKTAEMTETARHNRATEEGYFLIPKDSKAVPKHPMAAATGSPDLAASGPVDTDALWQAIKTQESGGQKSPGTAVGPDTPYGNALGSTQMLPVTAQAMATKLGLPWQPALLQANTPEALAYQDKLGRAYLQEGLDKYNGDPAKAAAYYFGGPDESLWKDKTHAYVQKVLSRAGGQPYEVAAGGATPPPPGSARPGDPPGTLYGNTDTPQTVDPNIVKGLLDGRIAPPTQKAAATPYWQAHLEAAAAEDPNFDMVNFGARSKTRADFTAGKSAQNVTALNTVVGHLDTLDKSINGLGNFGGFLGSTLNNRAAHFIARESGTDERLGTFNAAKTAVANEMTRVFRGTGGAEADIQGYLRDLDAAKSPETLHATLKQMAELINSRMEALGEQYNQGMGTTRDPLTLLTPDKQKAFNRLMGVHGDEPIAPTAAPSAKAAPASTGPVRVNSVAEAMALAPGTPFITPDGRHKVR